MIRGALRAAFSMALFIHLNKRVNVRKYNIVEWVGIS
jgi:hypothetical protein